MGDRLRNLAGVECDGIVSGIPEFITVTVVGTGPISISTAGIQGCRPDVRAFQFSWSEMPLQVRWSQGGYRYDEGRRCRIALTDEGLVAEGALWETATMDQLDASYRALFESSQRETWEAGEGRIRCAIDHEKYGRLCIAETFEQLSAILGSVTP